MGYTNSSLVNYKILTNSHSGQRDHVIDTITIHCVVGQTAADSLGYYFQKIDASSNYGVGYDGKIGLYVEEKNRAWTTSSYANDRRAVTIEVASDTYAPYKVTSAAYNALIKLVADICKRNGIKQLKWSTNKNERMNHLNGCNMTVHRDYANKSCPGDYLYGNMGDIAAKVNAIIGGASTVKITSDSKLRSKAYCGGDSKILANLKKGTAVTHISDDGCGWSKIKAGSNTGWVQNTRLSKSGLSSYPKMKFAVPVFKEPSTESKLLGHIDSSAAYTTRYIIESGKNAGWAEIAYPNSSGVGFVFGTYTN